MGVNAVARGASDGRLGSCRGSVTVRATARCLGRQGRWCVAWMMVGLFPPHIIRLRASGGLAELGNQAVPDGFDALLESVSVFGMPIRLFPGNGIFAGESDVHDIFLRVTAITI